MDYARHGSTQGTSDHNDLLAQHSTAHRSCGTQHIGTILDCTRHSSAHIMWGQHNTAHNTFQLGK